jgi:hypothetical protein
MKTTVAEPNASFLHAVSDQLLELVNRVEDDVARYADSRVGPAGGGFVIYYLTDENGEPLKDVTAADLGTSLADIVETRGFQQLQEHCEMRNLKVRIDEHFYASDPRPTKIYRVIIDGWQMGSFT